MTHLEQAFIECLARDSRCPRCGSTDKKLRLPHTTHMLCLPDGAVTHGMIQLRASGPGEVPDEPHRKVRRFVDGGGCLRYSASGASQLIPVLARIDVRLDSGVFWRFPMSGALKMMLITSFFVYRPVFPVFQLGVSHAELWTTCPASREGIPHLCIAGYGCNQAINLPIPKELR